MGYKFKCVLLAVVLIWNCTIDIYPQNGENAVAGLSEKPMNAGGLLGKPVNTAVGLSEKLIHSEGGIWAFSGFDNGLYYTYVLQFQDPNEICFEYLTKRNRYAAYTTNIQRRGTFTVENNILTANFTSVTGSQYNGPDPSDKPLSENLSQKMEIEITERTIMIQKKYGKKFYLDHPGYDQSRTHEVAATEYILSAKQMLGSNLFENQNEKIELIAERPIID
ncbi:MAG: hypothetical protein LBT26_02090 [Clostridiales Family XIII bacterium]|jgi:hypothetical protein|nr:hypothetical protein [Clostridiales Family XIII bacterium]